MARANEPEPRGMTGVCPNVKRWIALSLALLGCAPAVAPRPTVIQLPVGLPTTSPEQAGQPADGAAPELSRELPPTQPLGGTVLVPTGARLFEGPGLWLQSTQASYHVDNDWVERIRPMEVVGEAGEFYAIRTHHAAPEEGHCYATRDLFRRYDLVIYIPKDDVLPVLTEQVAKEWAGGTALHLEPGLGLIPLGKNRYRAVARPFFFELAVPAQSVGRRYRPTAPGGDVSLPTPQYELNNRSARIVIGGGIEARLVGPYALINQVTKHHLGALLTMRTRCATIQAILPPGEVVSVPEERTMSGYGTTCGGVVPGVDFQVKSGTPVYWRDRRPAGQTRHQTNLIAHNRKDVGDLACFPEGPTGRGCRSVPLQLCVRSVDLAIIPVKG
jgi:hypothetical protein